MLQQGGRRSVRAVFPGLGAAEKCVVCSRFNTVDIHKINLLSEEINPMPCSHGNTSHAAQFQSWDFMGSRPSWSSCFSGSSGPRNGAAGRVGVGQLELRNAGLELELLRNHFSHPALVSLRVFLESCGRPWIQMTSSLPAGPGRPSPGPGYPLLGGQPKAVSCQTQGPEPAEALSHLKGSWPRVAHPREQRQEGETVGSELRQ